MPLLYLAKVNLNSNIFEVYDNSLNLTNVLKNIYSKFDMGNTVKQRSREYYLDSFGNQKAYYRQSRYSFQEIKKISNEIITGKLVRDFTKPSERLDPITNTMVTITIEETVSIYFYYDVFHEMITFCERQSFGYNQFMGAFSRLLNQIAKPYEFEIFLQKDKDVLEEKLQNLITVQQVKTTLIPPNSNDDDLQDLRNELSYLQQCQEANAHKMDLTYTSNDLNMSSKVMQDIKTAVSRGYGDINATGINRSGRKQTIKSSQDAAYTINIQDNINDSDFNEESNNMILRFLAKITTKIFNKKGEPDIQ